MFLVTEKKMVAGISKEDLDRAKKQMFQAIQGNSTLRGIIS